MAEQAVTSQWAALADTQAKTYDLQNLGWYAIHFTTGPTAPADGIRGKILFPFGHYLSVGAATPRSGESIWVRSEGNSDSTIEYS